MALGHAVLGAVALINAQRAYGQHPAQRQGHQPLHRLQIVAIGPMIKTESQQQGNGPRSGHQHL